MKNQICFIPSESMPKQGKHDEILKKYADEWHVQELGGGNGNWLLTRSSDVIVNGKSYRKFILDYYGKTRLTENLFKKFVNDVESGKIQLQ